jgi:hypothetical protein
MLYVSIRQMTKSRLIFKSSKVEVAALKDAKNFYLDLQLNSHIFDHLAREFHCYRLSNSTEKSLEIIKLSRSRCMDFER